MNVSVSWWVGFHVLVLALLAVDLFVLRRDGHAPTFRESLGWSAFWIFLAMAFGGAIAAGLVGNFTPEARGQATLEYYTAYFMEESLSLDNVFVFALLFRHFHVAPAHQHGVLFWGVLGAMVMRLGMILGGIALVRRFEWILYIFGAYLLYGAWKMWRHQEGGGSPENSRIWKWLRRWLPAAEDDHRGRILIWEKGRLRPTPLFAVLLTLELTDVTFALDSVPAVLAVTRDPFVAYTSNVFAILGLRALYFLVVRALDHCWMLHYGLALLLAFIGVKMLLPHDYQPGIAVSLAVIATLVFGSIGGSWLVKKPKSAPH